MTNQVKKLMTGTAVIGVMALGGTALAQAQTSPVQTHEKVSSLDGDNVQSGDQTTPDTTAGATKVSLHRHVLAPKRAAADAKDSGAPETSGSGAAETKDSGAAEAPERGAGSESTGPSDGPGGHADPAGANVDHQAQGNE